MAKQKKEYICTKCNRIVQQWAGQCPGCGEWASLEEREAGGSSASKRSVGTKSSGGSSLPSTPAQHVKTITAKPFERISTSNSEFDRVLGGGLVPGGVVLLAAQPGAGKSTLVGQIAHEVAETGRVVLYISGEESAEQVAMRSQRIGADSDNLFIASESDLAKVLGHIEALSPEFVVIDSVQTIASAELDGRMGERAQVIEVSTLLTRTAKALGIPIILIGHENKDGNIAGPRTMEHLVDVVLHMEGSKDTPLKFLRGVKNRYGSSDEVGCFEHTEHGIREVPDPSGLLLGRRDKPTAGVVASIVLEGNRPLPVEVQALVTPSPLPVPRKATSGLDVPRSVMLTAVTERHGKVRLADKDVYLATIGGMKIREPAADLATVFALVSAGLEIEAHTDMVAMGEVTLSGEVRTVQGIGRRVAESRRLGFKKAFIPQGSAESVSEADKGAMVLIEVENVKQVAEIVKAM